MVTASLVKELREKTGAGMMDCKKVLTETDGDMEKAIELLRERGIAKAAKKSDRIAAEGLVEAYVSADGKTNTNFLAKGVYEGPCLNSSDGTVTDGTLILKTLKGKIFGEATVSNSSFELAIDSNTANTTGNVATAIQDAK